MSKRPRLEPLRSWESTAAANSISDASPRDSDVDDKSDDSDPDDAPKTQADFGDDLVDLLLTQLYKGQMSARLVCIICHLASNAGAQGSVSQYAFRVDAPSGHYQRHIDSMSGVNMKREQADMYKVPMARYAKYDVSRSKYDMPVQLPHEVLAREVAEDSSILRRCRERAWPPSYHENEIVREAAQSSLGGPVVPVVPCALYCDGVPCTKRDSILAFWCYNLITEKRSIICALRKSELCRCGCRGWCSLFPLFAMMRWSFSALTSGKYPTTNHTNGPLEGARKEVAGTTMPCRFVLLHIKGDWSEFVTTFAFAAWSTIRSPCFLCDVTLDRFFELSGMSPLRFPFNLISSSDYDAACSRCEIHVTLSEDDHRRLRHLFHYDKRKTGSHGRALLQDVNALGLRKGDRLEPCPNLVDPGDFEAINVFPVQLTFWRRDSESRTKHRNPILQVPGVCFSSFCPDILHTLYLGTAKDYCAYALWALIGLDVFQTGASTQEERLQLSVFHLRQRLWSYYRERRRQNPGRQITELENLTANMLGTQAKPTLSTKAAETKHFLPFVLDTLRHFRAQLEGLTTGEALLRTGESLQEYIELLDSSPLVVPDSTIQKMYAALGRFFSLWKLAQLHQRPKFHLMAHVLAGNRYIGNPTSYSTFADESLNRVIANIGRAAHRSVWEVRVHVHFRKAEELRARC
jgi:hypothetical protein